MELVIEKDIATIDYYKRNVCNDIAKRIISMNIKNRNDGIKFNEYWYRTIHKGYLKINGYGRLNISADLIVDNDYDAFLETPEIEQKLVNILLDLDMTTLFTVCENYSYSVEESTDYNDVSKYTIVYDSFNELKNMLIAQTIDDNKKLHEKIDKLSGHFEDVLALFNDVDALNNQKIEK